MDGGESASARLRHRFRSGPALIFDSAMGTEIERRGIASRLPLWSARALLAAPGQVLAIHRENVAAGAEVLTANTFRTHRRTLAKEGLGERAAALTRLAVSLAREASHGAGREVFVVGSLAPLEDCYRPDLVPGESELHAEHVEQVGALRAAGVDGILVETQNSVRELVAAVRAAKATHLPVVASVVTDGRGHLLSGEPIARAVAVLASEAPEALGINCVPARLLSDDLRLLAAAAPGAALAAYGNLGPPVDPEGLHFIDDVPPDEYARLAREWLAIGARMVGGCCGTQPAHIAAIAKVLGTRGSVS
jgi:S-methylmethionine-dependent homocysteine/selenocysteine methylase